MLERFCVLKQSGRLSLGGADGGPAIVRPENSVDDCIETLTERTLRLIETGEMPLLRMGEAVSSAGGIASR